MSQRKTTSLSLEADDIARLQAIAEKLGYLATQGPTTGSGSVSALMRAIADGEVIVTVPTRPPGYETMTEEEYRRTEAYLNA